MRTPAPLARLASRALIVLAPVIFAVVVLCAAAPLPASAAPAPPAPRTLRVDYFHTGNAVEERFSLDGLVLEPLPWPGNPRRPLDDTNLGKYFFEVHDAATQRLVYSRGFSSIYGEWETTPEAKGQNRTFHESLRFPLPERPVQVVLKKRDPRTNLFREVWSLLADPRDMFIDSAAPPSPGPLLALQNAGDPAAKLDLLILGDGYGEKERAKFEKDARRLVDILFSREPFKSRRQEFNVWGLCPPSPESGISRPSTGVHHRSRIGATYDAFGSERYILTFDNRAFRDVASFAPYEFVEILANGNTYGGGGIFGLYSTVASDTLFAPYIFVHELGHHIAGLADEYFTSASAYESQAERPEPWEPNVTALKDPANLKWADLLGRRPGEAAKQVPLPTPWDHDGFEAWEKTVQARRREIRARKLPESAMDALFLEELKESSKRLSAEKYAAEVGAFEGANYESKGYFRPQADCIMFTRDEVPFCRVCQASINRVIDLYTGQAR